MKTLKDFGNPIFQKILDRKKIFTESDQAGKISPSLRWVFNGEGNIYLRMKSSFYTIQNGITYIYSNNMKARHLISDAPYTMGVEGNIHSWRVLSNSMAQKYANEASNALIDNNSYDPNTIYYLVGPKIFPRSKFNKPELLPHDDRIKPMFIAIDSPRLKLSNIYLSRSAISSKLRADRYYGLLIKGPNNVFAETLITDFKELSDMWE